MAFGPSIASLARKVNIAGGGFIKVRGYQTSRGRVVSPYLRAYTDQGRPGTGSQGNRTYERRRPVTAAMVNRSLTPREANRIFGDRYQGPTSRDLTRLYGKPKAPVNNPGGVNQYTNRRRASANRIRRAREMGRRADQSLLRYARFSPGGIR